MLVSVPLIVVSFMLSPSFCADTNESLSSMVSAACVSPWARVNSSVALLKAWTEAPDPPVTETDFWSPLIDVKVNVDPLARTSL